MTDQQISAGLGPYYMVGLATGEVDTSHTLPAYNPNISPVVLQYNSLASDPRPMIVVHHELDSSLAIPNKTSARMFTSAVS